MKKHGIRFKVPEPKRVSHTGLGYWKVVPYAKIKRNSKPNRRKTK